MSTVDTRTRYDRLAPLYDLLEAIPEFQYRFWRERFWSRVSEKLGTGNRLLEVGVGTGKNIAYWPSQARVTTVDISPRMLRRAAKRARRLQRVAQFEIGDAQDLQFPSNSFDVAAMSFVMCSVPDPVQGLQEVARVVRPGGSILLMEHVRAANIWLGKLMDLVNPLVVRFLGPNINRDTVLNTSSAGLELTEVQNIGLGGIFKMIEVRVPWEINA